VLSPEHVHKGEANMRTLLFAMVAGMMMATPVLAGDCCTAPAVCGPEACDPAETCGPAVCDPGCGPACCDPGCMNCSRKVCRVVCDTKKVKKVIWQVQCEDFCPQLPACGVLHDCLLGACKKKGCCDPGCCETACCEPTCCEASCCGDACGAMDCCDPCESVRKAHADCAAPPRCGKVRGKKKLLRKEIECEVPVYKCVVMCVDPCGTSCGVSCGEGEVAPSKAPAEGGQETESAPLPPVVGTSYLK